MRYILSFIAVFLAIIPISNTFAVDALQELPTRLVMSNERSSELTLVNKGTDPGTYRIILRNIRTDDYGKFSEAQQAGEKELFADNLIRYSPRRVEIEAGSFQKVRVMVRKPKNLPEGEYRTHMVFQSLPPQNANTLDESGELSVSVDPIVEVSIPVIIRNGKLSAALSIADVSLKESAVQFTLNRDGARSTYGDVEVVVDSGVNKGTRVGFIRGLSVYYPNDKRYMNIPLTLPESHQAFDSLLVRFVEDPTYGGEHSISAKYTPK